MGTGDSIFSILLHAPVADGMWASPLVASHAALDRSLSADASLRATLSVPKSAGLAHTRCVKHGKVVTHPNSTSCRHTGPRHSPGQLGIDSSVAKKPPAQFVVRGKPGLGPSNATFTLCCTLYSNK